MNREIIFKAKRVDNGEWVYGNLINTDEGYCISVNAELSTYDNADLYSTEWYKIIPETVCQYTGLTDKNGNNAFSDDVVLFNNEHKYQIIIKDTKLQLQSLDNENTYRDLYYFRNRFSTMFEVIGSIHDKEEMEQ